jgi:hypothetical protein
MRPNCYQCIHRREAVGSAHSTCVHPEALSAAKSHPVAELFAILGSVGRGPGLNVRAMGVEGHPHGVRMGWFNWPINFDPVWLNKCDGFEAIT